MRPPFIVNSLADAEALGTELYAHSLFEDRPVGYDVETTGCDPEEESPVERAQVWCHSFAWGEARDLSQTGPSDFFTAWCPHEFAAPLKGWLENPTCTKVCTNGDGYERHALANHGIDFHGMVACTASMSRLLDPSRNGGHGLKPWGEKLGYTVYTYEEIVGVARQGGQQKARLLKNKRTKQYEQVYDYTVVHWDEPDMQWLWANKPERRASIIKYSVQDAAMSLDAYWVLLDKLLKLRWAA